MEHVEEQSSTSWDGLLLYIHWCNNTPTTRAMKPFLCPHSGRETSPITQWVHMCWNQDSWPTDEIHHFATNKHQKYKDSFINARVTNLYWTNKHSQSTYLYRSLYVIYMNWWIVSRVHPTIYLVSVPRECKVGIDGNNEYTRTKIRNS